VDDPLDADAVAILSVNDMVVLEISTARTGEVVAIDPVPDAIDLSDSDSDGGVEHAVVNGTPVLPPEQPPQKEEHRQQQQRYGGKHRYGRR
jgi:hypothetical protein